MSAQRCDTCGRFMSPRQLATALYVYDLRLDGTGNVYGLQTATRLIEPRRCRECSETLRDRRMVESYRDTAWEFLPRGRRRIPQGELEPVVLNYGGRS